jgi:hypothetical protein
MRGKPHAMPKWLKILRGETIAEMQVVCFWLFSTTPSQQLENCQVIVQAEKPQARVLAQK